MDKKEAIKRIQEHMQIHFVKEPNAILITEALGMAIEALSQPEPKWIPCSERLPEDGDDVLFCSTNNNVYHGRYYKNGLPYPWYCYKHKSFTRDCVVTAWMPLPEPYKASLTGEGEEE